MKIKIPIGLSSHYANHRAMIRIMATFCRLKAVESSSRIIRWRSQLDHLASLCRFSTRTLETRISEMRSMGLASLDKNGDLILISWDKLWSMTNIITKKKRYWYYDDNKLDFKLEYLLQLLAIKEKKRSIECAYKTRTENIPGYLGELKIILGYAHTHTITMREHLAGVVQAFQTGQFSSNEEYLLNAVNPDSNISVKKMRSFFGYAEKSVSGPSYRKKILCRLGLLEIEKRALESSVRARECIAGKVHYSRSSQTTFLRLCDALTTAL